MTEDREPVDDEFFSAEDAALRDLDPDEYRRLWMAWFRAAQTSNDRDAHVYSHGAVAVEPGWEHLLEEIRHGLR